MSQPTRMPASGHDYTAELLAVAIAEAELRNNTDDLHALVEIAVAEHPRRVIEVLANFLAVEFANGYGQYAAALLNELRWGILDPNPRRA